MGSYPFIGSNYKDKFFLFYSPYCPDSICHKAPSRRATWCSRSAYYLLPCRLPSQSICFIWGRSAFENGGASSFGQVAGLYKVPILPFLSESIRLSPGLIPSLLFIAFGLVYCVNKGRRAVLGPDFLALLITIVFGISALASLNRQIRYAFPAVVAPPFLIAILLYFKADPISDRPAALAAGLVFLGLLIAGVPTEHRPDRQSINRSEAALTQAANCNARSIILATDSLTLNMDLMDLAEVLDKTEPG